MNNNDNDNNNDNRHNDNDNDNNDNNNNDNNDNDNHNNDNHNNDNNNDNNNNIHAAHADRCSKHFKVTGQVYLQGTLTANTRTTPTSGQVCNIRAIAVRSQGRISEQYTTSLTNKQQQ